MPHLIIVTGLSGSGKSTALNALEDIGWFCMDNVPAILLPKVMELAEQQEPLDRMAVGIDARERQFLDDVLPTIERLKTNGVAVRVLFIDAETPKLMSRYSATRRRHPIGNSELSLSEAIESERALLAPLREAADLVLDSTTRNVHELKRRVQDEFDDGIAAKMSLRFVSFGFKHGITPEADLVFDVRFLQNPYFEEELRDKVGLDPEVSQYIFAQDSAQTFVEMVLSLLRFLLPRYADSGKAYLTVAIGCTGGQHRSVAMVERIAADLRQASWESTTAHRESHRWPR